MTTTQAFVNQETHYAAATRPSASRPQTDARVRLIRDLRRRVTPVRTAAAAHIWPAAELDTLVRFLRESVLPEISAERQRALCGHRAFSDVGGTNKTLLDLYGRTCALIQTGRSDPDALAAVVELTEQLLKDLDSDLH